MYSILFHVGWLALIEIIFYFQYIGPLESDLFKDSIKNIINDYKIKNNDVNNNNQLVHTIFSVINIHSSSNSQF